MCRSTTGCLGGRGREGEEGKESGEGALKGGPERQQKRPNIVVKSRNLVVKERVCERDGGREGQAGGEKVRCRQLRCVRAWEDLLSMLSFSTIFGLLYHYSRSLSKLYHCSRSL